MNATPTEQNVYKHFGFTLFEFDNLNYTQQQRLADTFNAHAAMREALRGWVNNCPVCGGTGYTDLKLTVCLECLNSKAALAAGGPD